MDIIHIEKNCIRIKGKTASFLLDPLPGIAKNSADAILFLNEDAQNDISKIEGVRLIIKAPGEYEVGGVKISGIRTEDYLTYIMNIDGIEVFIGNGEAMQKIQEKVKECDVAIVITMAIVNGSFIAALSPKVLVLVGIGALGLAKALGKENTQAATKTQVTKEKLPDEMDVVVLAS